MARDERREGFLHTVGLLYPHGDRPTSRVTALTSHSGFTSRHCSHLANSPFSIHRDGLATTCVRSRMPCAVLLPDAQLFKRFKRFTQAVASEHTCASGQPRENMVAFLAHWRYPSLTSSPLTLDRVSQKHPHESAHVCARSNMIAHSSPTA